MNPPEKATSLLPILLLSAAGFTVLTTEFLIVGLLPAMARDLHVSIPQAGLLVTLFAFTVAALGPFLTAWMSGYPRKALFVTVLLLFGISNVIAALAPNIGVMAFARFIPAVALPVFWALASETALDITGPEKAGKAISMVSFGIVAATVFGIPIGTLISDAFGWRMAFGFLAVLSFSKALMLFVKMPQTVAKKSSIPILTQLGILKSPVVVGHVLLSVLVFAGMFTAYTYLADILERLAGFDGSTVGWCLMGFGAVGMIGNWFGGRMVDRSPLGATILFTAPMALGMIGLVPVVSNHGLLALVLIAWGIAQAALFTISHARVMKAAPGAAALGASLNISGANLGIGLGALLGGKVIDHYGLGGVGWAAAGVVGLAIVTSFVLMLAKKEGASPAQDPCADLSV